MITDLAGTIPTNNPEAVPQSNTGEPTNLAQSTDIEQFSRVLNEYLEEPELAKLNLEQVNLSQFQSEDGSLDIQKLLNFLEQSGVTDPESLTNMANKEAEIAESALIVSGEQQTALKSNSTNTEPELSPELELKEHKQNLKVSTELSQTNSNQSQEQKFNKEGMQQKLESLVNLKNSASEIQFGGELKTMTEGGKVELQQHTLLSNQVTNGQHLIEGGRAPAPSHKLAINQPVFSNDWGDAFKEQIAWLSNQQVKSAAIKLSPIELGPIEVNIQVTKDQANIQFNSHNTQVRELIEQALPKLREMLNQQGLNLADVNVSANSQGKEFGERVEQVYNGDEVSYEEEEIITPISSHKPNGLVDYFA